MQKSCIQVCTLQRSSNKFKAQSSNLRRKFVISCATIETSSFAIFCIFNVLYISYISHFSLDVLEYKMKNYLPTANLVISLKAFSNKKVCTYKKPSIFANKMNVKAVKVTFSVEQCTVENNQYFLWHSTWQYPDSNPLCGFICRRVDTTGRLK